MACCAFAAFLLINLLGPLAFLRRRLFGEAPPRNAAVAWRYGDPAATVGAVPVNLRARLRAGAGVILAVEAALVVGAALYLLPVDRSAAAAVSADGWDAFVALHTSWCAGGGADPVVELVPMEG